MAENVYEGLFILDSNRYARDASGVSTQLEQLIKERGGELLVSRLWEERRLAYPIKGQRKGTYWLTYFRADSGHLPNLRRQCQIHDAILRHLVLKVDPRIIEALVEHATASDKEPAADDAKAGATETAEPVAVQAGAAVAQTGAGVAQTGAGVAQADVTAAEGEAPAEPPTES